MKLQHQNQYYSPLVRKLREIIKFRVVGCGNSQFTAPCVPLHGLPQLSFKISSRSARLTTSSE